MENNVIKIKPEISSDVLSLINAGKTSLGNNSIINDIISDDGFIEDMAKSQFDISKKALLSIGGIDDIDDDSDLMSILGKLIKKCSEIEKQHKDQLEKLCVNYVIKLFNIPDDTIEFETKLVDSVVIPNGLQMNKNSINNEIEDVKSGANLKKELDKRRILNALCVGAGIHYSSNIDSYFEEINKIDNRLTDLYKKIIPINTYLLFCNKITMSEKHTGLCGICEVKLGNYDELVLIKSQGTLFPFLLSETIRGVMELSASHGLPHNDNIKKEILSKCDYLKSEPWNMRIGGEMWRNLIISFDSKEGMIPYWFKELSTLDTSVFSDVIPEIFSKTKRSKNIVKLIYKKAVRQFDKDNFDSEMSILSTDKNIISDGTI